MLEQVLFEEYESAKVKLTDDEYRILVEKYTKNLEITKIDQGTYWVTAKQYVGNIVLPNHVLVIKPKIPNLNFFRMLFSTYNFNLDFKKDEYEYAKEQEIFELILDHFLYRIEQLTKQGFSKGYVDEEENINLIRGRVLIKEDLKHNPIIHNKIFCRYSEFTSDIIENRIIKYTLHYLSKVRLENRFLQKRIRQNLCFFDQVTFVHISAKNFPKLNYTRLTERYRPIINWCRIIIQNSTLNLQKSGDIRCFSFLVDMNRLFENFLLGLLKKKLKDFVVRGMGHGMSSYSLDIAGKMTQKPDIVIRKGNIDLLVIDAKYKRLQTDSKKQAKIIISDSRQVWSYCLVPDRKLPCGVLVYPKHWLSEDIKSIHALKNSVTLVIKTLDLSKEPKKDFIEECDRFAYELAHLIEQEVMQYARS